jgi:hypothetical protein
VRHGVRASAERLLGYSPAPSSRRPSCRARCERPRRRTAEQRDELPSPEVEHGLLPGTRYASLPQAQGAPEAPPLDPIYIKAVYEPCCCMSLATRLIARERRSGDPPTMRKRQDN